MNIKLTGCLDAADGYGQITENLALALLDLGHNVTLNPIKIWFNISSLKKETRELIDRQLPSIDFELVVFYPSPSFGNLNSKAALLTMYEANRCPTEWTKMINRLKIPVFAPSKFVQQMFIDSGVKVPVDYLPLGVDNTFYSKSKRAFPKKEAFRFLSVGKMEPRKNIEVAVEAFEEAFSADKNVEFVIKTRERFLPSSVKALAKVDSRIKIIEKTISEKEMLELYKSCHCFVYPSRGEGFSFPPRYALETGMPAMVTNWSSLSEISGAIKIPVKSLSPMPPCGFSYGEHDKLLMADVEVKTLAEIMKHVTNKSVYDILAKKAFDCQQISWGESAKSLISLIRNYI